ncbi:ARID BRIGHT DNA-binding domain-containing [Lecanosticta acicola]|uniref:ARID BRIGHT DNA-binding domain-containing n=1 Tax=Lecanosticta acicola TaxID=111012 RepID=A0AAI9E9K4_9PEZI|nr:ARID BRIGHT DNA-binding domain-containing [Lecanosticta acicola]
MNQGWANGQMTFPNVNPQSMYNPQQQQQQQPQQQPQPQPQPQQFDLTSFTPNGAPSQTGTPQPAQQTFTPGSVVPAKRPHDGMSASPQQPQHSRSHTPSFAPGGFPNPQFPNAPTPLQRFQQQPGSNNATPSPTMSNQQFHPPQPGQQQRMNNASPFPGQQPNYGTQMSPAPNGSNMQQQGNMSQYGGQYGMNPGMSMAGMPNAMAAQINNMSGNIQPSAQRAYQMKLMQHQQQLRASGMMPPQQRMGGQPNQMNNFGGQQPGVQMPNGQPSAMQAHQMQMMAKKKQFLSALQQQAQQQGRPFNPNPTIGNRPLDLFNLWQVTVSAGGAQKIDQAGQWPLVAQKLGFIQQQFPSAAEEIKMIHQRDISSYERLFMQAQMQKKQEAARMHAQQMAGYSNQPQQSPTKMMQIPGQQNQFSPMQQGQQNSQQPQGTPVQANATLPQNGMSTPQHMTGAQANLHHRRNSSLRKPEQMTPQPVQQPGATASPLMNKQQRPPSVKQEPSGPVMKSEEPQSTHYVPLLRDIDTDGGYDTAALFDLGNTIARAKPNHPTVDEMGVIDTKAITLSLASGLHAEVRYALDTLAIISHDTRVGLNLENCDDLMDVIVDCAEDQTDILSEEAAEVSDALDLSPYEDILRNAKVEADTLQEVPAFGTPAYELDRAADKVIAITTILRNFSFYEHNHRLLTAGPLIKWLSNTIRLLGTRNMLLRTHFNTQDFYKDIIIFLSNVTQSLELPSRDDALHILHFLLAFAPQPAPIYGESGDRVRFPSFVPANHKYLPPAVDCLAKLLARQDPNRMLYKSIFTATSSSLAASESPLDLLTRAFGLSISVLPDRSKGSLGNSMQLRIVEARKAYLTQGMLAADILTTLAASNDTALARAWIESEDGWAVGLLNLAALLSVDHSKTNGPKGRDLGWDVETFKLITFRALTMMKRLAEKAGKGALQNLQHAVTKNGAVNGETANGIHDDKDDLIEALKGQPKWEGIPQGHAILGALMMPNTDKVALGLLCGLHEMAMQQPNTSS